MLIRKPSDNGGSNQTLSKIMKQILLFLFAILLITSCAKKRTAVVKGRVLNPVTGEGISNAKITMYHSKLTSYDNDIKVDAQTFSASNGSFEISSKGFKAYELACVLEGDYYYLRWLVNGEYKSSFQPLEGKTQDVDFHAVPYGQIILDIENINCLSSNDSMQFRRKYQFDNTFPENWSTFRLGCYTYISPEPFNLPMGYHVYETKVLRNGLTTFYYDTVYLYNNGVATAEIRY